MVDEVNTPEVPSEDEQELAAIGEEMDVNIPTLKEGEPPEDAEKKKWQRAVTKMRQKDTEKTRALEQRMAELEGRLAQASIQSPRGQDVEPENEETRRATTFVDERTKKYLDREVKPVMLGLGKALAEVQAATVVQSLEAESGMKLSRTQREAAKKAVVNSLVGGRSVEDGFYAVIGREHAEGRLSQNRQNAPPVTESGAPSGPTAKQEEGTTEEEARKMSEEQLEKKLGVGRKY